MQRCADAAARSTGLAQRVWAISGAQFVQTPVFGWLDNPDAAYEDLVATAEALGVTITEQGLSVWLGAPSTACLAQVLQAAIAQLRPHQSPGLPEQQLCSNAQPR